MCPDEFQQAWKAESTKTRVTVDPSVLLHVVQRHQHELRTAVIWGDLSVIAMEIVLLCVLVYLGFTFALPWTWYLVVAGAVWSAVLKIVLRARHNAAPNDPDEPLLSGVRDSLMLLDHQICFQRTAFWWSQLPAAIAMVVFFAHVSWLNAHHGYELAIAVCLSFLFVSAVYSSSYYMVHRSVRTKIEPKRRELRALLASLADETRDPEIAEYPILLGQSGAVCSRRNMMLRGLCGLVLLGIGVGGIVFLHDLQQGYPKKSPFTAVRWQDSQPQVQVDDQWYTLVSLNGISTADMVAFSKETYGNRWQKRFEEDLVEILTRMGFPPEDTVTLVVRSATTSDTITLEDVPMTRANREAIRDAAQARELRSQHEGMRPAVPIEDTEQFQARVDEFLHDAHETAGFSGAVIVARGGTPVYEGAFGISNLKTKSLNTLDTPFRIASLSKQFTAAAVLRLEGDGKLRIDDPVHNYLPEFSEAPYDSITLYHLLTHTSGLPRTPQSLPGNVRWNAMSRDATPVGDYVQLAVETPLVFEPGTDYEYSNFGYRILSAVIEGVAGRQYADYMEEEVFRPLSMKNSGVARISRPSAEDRVAEGLFSWSGFFTGQPSFKHGENGRNFGTGYGSGGIYTSARDLLVWDRVLANDAFLSADQKERLFRPNLANYACGWIVKECDLDGRLYQMHNGANEAFFSQMMRIPGDDLVIIAIGNIRATDAIDTILENLFLLCRSLPYRDP